MRLNRLQNNVKLHRLMKHALFYTARKRGSAVRQWLDRAESRVWLRSKWGGWFVTDDMLFMNQHNCLCHFLVWATHSVYLHTLYRLESGIILPSQEARRMGGGVSFDLETSVELDWRALCVAVTLKRWSGKVMNSCGIQIWPRPSATACSGTRGQQNGQMARDWTHKHSHTHTLTSAFSLFFNANPHH